MTIFGHIETSLRKGKTVLNATLSAAIGVRYVSDVPERLCRLGFPTYADGKRRRMIDAVRARGVLFVHVPKNAGTSISHTLYGQQVKHRTVTYYASLAPDLLDLPSFAIVRDPVDRFLSAFHFARTGGNPERPVSSAFRSRYMKFRDLDDAIEHVATARSIFDVDHIFRPQGWYLADRDQRIAVDHLVPYQQIEAIAGLPCLKGLGCVPRLNEGKRSAISLKAHQLSFIREFYAADFALLEQAEAQVAPRIAQAAC